MISFTVGATGADWFYLAKGNVGYIIAGIIKLIIFLLIIALPCGFYWYLFCHCLGNERKREFDIYFAKRIITVILIIILVLVAIWWLVDWIRILTESFKDGNNVSLKNW